ncbi:endonuclease/exonuclease/phosphatase family domain-containing protein 1-like [Athalia rosae]|uniref:endonuclease/exonuclease/phosphatase family domain-containing protein 1-like n=1 Tax=Athalia rosae TaxID=37344 RepID=UPI002034432C|nr:endonuclease/exonuclease/phosphatase family domain-containing protein 1-like [Athalia rosae]
MGQTGSSNIHHHGGRGSKVRSLRRVSLGGLGKKHFKNHKISHTFTYIDGNIQVDQLNINTATEEELMTLPGINRAVARNIVNHRQAIGRFRRVEDLALVSGIGAYKLELVKPEICVTPGGDVSEISSRASTSLDSIGNSGSLLDINSASVYALQGIPGFNQELAANVVEKRHRRGPYRTLDELLKVRGIGRQRLELIKPYLKVAIDSDGSVTPTPSNSTSPSLWNNPRISSTPISGYREKVPTETSKVNGVNSRTNFDKISLETTSVISEEEIWELLSVASPRPLIPCDFLSRLGGRTSLRIATWNLESFTVDKACNPGVREVICRTILENRLSLLAIQEIDSSEALAKVTLELNTPSLKRVKDWQENRRTWRSVHLGQGLAILWDADAKIGISLQEQPPLTENLFPLAACATFDINKLSVTVVNLTSRSAKDLKTIENLCDCENSLIVGDFSRINQAERLDLEFSSQENTSTDSAEYSFNDNIAWGKKSRTLFYTGYSGIIRRGLTHLGIPRGWKWGGAVSSHCPVWCQIYSQADNY